MKKHIYIILFSVLIFSCSNDDNEEACPDIYAPVCGSNGETYSNDCYARVAGISEYTIGECPE